MSRMILALAGISSIIGIAACVNRGTAHVEMRTLAPVTDAKSVVKNSYEHLSEGLSTTSNGLYKVYDREEGIVCYVYYAYRSDVATLNCMVMKDEPSR